MTKKTSPKMCLRGAQLPRRAQYTTEHSRTATGRRHQARVTNMALISDGRGTVHPRRPRLIRFASSLPKGRRRCFRPILAHRLYVDALDQRGPERKGGKRGGAHALDEIARLSGILHAFLTGDRTVTILGYRSVT